MRQICVFFLFLNTFSLFSHETHFGIDISPGWSLNSHRTNTTAWYAEHGYGFNSGLAIKHFFNEYNALQTGLTFEYIAFDNWAQNQLVSSLRFGALHMPLSVNFDLSFMENWYFQAGGGIKYMLMNNFVSLGSKIPVSSSINRFQPYGALGMNTFIERSNGYFEVGILARYHFLELWNEVQTDLHGYSSHIISIDLLLRYYI